MRLAAFVAALAAAALSAGVARAQTGCAGLVSVALPHARVTAAADTLPANGAAVCKVEVTAKPTADSDVRIEVWVPEGVAWNGRYVQLGNGGFAGQIDERPLAMLAAGGYAVAATDDGHRSAGETDATWALGHPEKVVDYGWRALRETTEAAKALIRALAGAPAKYAYFEGCSDGGREALMEAQRFPNDFDGVIAGAPSASPGLVRMWTQGEQALMRPGGYLDEAALQTLQHAALGACGGGAYIADPGLCRFDPASTLCKAGHASACLTAAQVATAETIYGGLTGLQGTLVPGPSPGAEAADYSWGVWMTGPSAAAIDQAVLYQFAAGYWRDIVFGDPKLDIRTLDLAAAARAEAKVSGELTPGPDLSRFRAAGGKLVEYQGWNDPAIPARASIAYYEDMRRTVGGDADAFYRLYLIPGMLHCGGGPGPSDVAWLDVLRTWVERGEAPGPLTATASSPTGHPAGSKSQLICPYPGTADGDRCVSVQIEMAPAPPPR
jgi:feruloyl esterase